MVTVFTQLVLESTAGLGDVLEENDPVVSRGLDPVQFVLQLDVCSTRPAMVP